MDTGSPALALLWLPVLLAVATAAGGQLLRWARVRPADPLEGLVFSAAAGLGVLAYAILAVGLLGAFNRGAFLLLLLALALLGAPCAVSAVRGRVAKASRPATAERPHATQWSVRLLPWLAAAAGLYVAGATLLAALAPPGGNDWDGLAYHLAAPKVYLRHGRIHFIPYDSHTDFPFTMEMLYGLGLSLAGAPLARLLHWSAGGLTALAVAAFCRAHLFRRCPNHPAPGGTAKTWAPPLAAALFLSVPQVAWEATTAYIDLGTALFQFLALYALTNAITRREEPAPKRPPISWWLIAGAMSGWAMGTKYTALIPFGMLLVAAGVWALAPSAQHAARSTQPAARQGHRLAAWRSRMSPPSPSAERRAPSAAFLALLLAAVVVASPWYLKNLIWTNNPVYPFFYHWFPRSVNWTQEAEDAYRMEQRSFGIGHRAADLVMAPWQTAMEGAAFFTVRTKDARPDSLTRYGGIVLGSVGIALLGLAPLWPFAHRVDRRAAWLLAYVGANFVAWFWLSQQTRYLLPVLAPAAIVAVAVLAALPHGFLRVAAGCFAGLALLINLTATQQLTIAPALPVVLGQESPDVYLSRTLPDLYPAMQFVNTLPPNARVAFYEEVRGFYADRDYFWANPLQNNLIPYETLTDGAALARFLRERLGITHVLINLNFARDSKETRWYRLVQDGAQKGPLYLLYDAFGIRIYEIR
jgi:hypothetical protein